MAAVPFVWRDAYDLHIEDMDVQHRRLAKMVESLAESVIHGRSRTERGRRLGQLLEFVKIHFSDEEQFMADHGYSGLKEHADEHERFAAELRDLQLRFDGGMAELDSAVLEHVAQWLDQHMAGPDRQYAEEILPRYRTESR
jgi:hemerythrin